MSMPLLLWSACRKDLLEWQQTQQLETHGAHRLNKIFFTDAQNGFVVGGDRFLTSEILSTHDGGLTWTLATFPQAGKELFDMVQSPQRSLYTIGFDGKLLASDDAGSSWQFFQSDYEPFKGMAFLADNKILLVGGVSFDYGIMAEADTNGHIMRISRTPYELNRLQMYNGHTGYACGHGVVLRTDDGGNQWDIQHINGDNFTGCYGKDPQTVWVCGYNGSIFKTTDGGIHWQRLRNGNDLLLPRYKLLDMLFLDDDHGYAVGENGLVIYTDDGGRHWMEYDRFTKDALYCIYQTPNGKLLAAGENGALFLLTAR
jgi:photosystem II stability/assembly factor-like uncharacterized protein